MGESARNKWVTDEVNLLSCKAKEPWDEHSIEEPVKIIIDCTSLYKSERLHSEKLERVECLCKKHIISLHKYPNYQTKRLSLTQSCIQQPLEQKMCDKCFMEQKDIKKSGNETLDVTSHLNGSPVLVERILRSHITDSLTLCMLGNLSSAKMSSAEFQK
ncbi:hypothetical protein DPMN_101034 [Dreissena polymorpha]|uniref:Uncharacterized protein n=1 Tax=Dreissena polymorpha TaxID=45954 RepID=A0A9D4LGV5_DREPO|nr:hypothetical protein DPMN_101034 [Dreissena polymorpha]